MLREGVNGFGMDANSESSMAQALHRMTALDDAERERFSRASLDIAAEQSLDRWAERVRGALLGLGAPARTAA
jgi:hypothetical protein